MRYTHPLALACAMVLCSLSSAHAADKTTDPNNIPAVTDWSSRSVVYSKPMTPDEFAAAGRSADIARLYNDPRYVAQLLRRIDSEMPAPDVPRTSALQRGSGSVAATAKSTAATCPTKRGPDPRSWHCTDTPQDDNGDVARDWSNVLGGGTNGLGGRGLEGVYPAKYRFDITAPVSSANCPTDFVVYPTNAAGATQNGTGQESWAFTFTDNATAGRTFIVGPTGPRQVVLIASTTLNTGKYFQTGTTNNARAANLRAAINRWSGQTGFFADAATNATVTVRSRTIGGIDDSFVTSNLDNVTIGTHTDGSGTTPGQPTIIAFNQLYNTTCNATRDNTNAPNVMWSYNTGSGYVVETSPVLSWHDDGKQVAFIQRNTSTGALQLVLLKPAALGTSAARLAAAANPTALTSLTAAQYNSQRSGSTAIMYAVTLYGNTNTGNVSTYSSPFVDYAKDELYVGDGNGSLHKFKDVFKGTPIEETGYGFPATVAAGMKLSSPVYYNSNVYIGSQSGSGDLGGKLHRISSTNGSNKFDSTKLANVDSTGLRESAIITSTPVGEGSVFIFLFNDGTAGNTADCAPDTSTGGDQESCRVVARFTPGFAAGAAPAQRTYVGRGNSRYSSLYAGAFDDAYYSSGTGTGAMYIVGGDPLTTFDPTLWKIPLTNGVMGAPSKGPKVGINCNNDTMECLTSIWNWSPVAYAKQGTNEYIYFSMPYEGNQTGCYGACLYMFQLNNLRNGTVERWEVRIARGNNSNGTRQGIDNAATTGNLTVNGIALLPNVHFSTAGSRSQDRTALVAAINTYTSYSAVETGDCTNQTSSNCAITITSNTPGNLNANLVTANSLSNVTVPGNNDGTTGNVVPWGTTATANASLQTPGGTGGIVIDNNSTAPGAAQIYFTQQAAGGNAVQASQSGLE